MNYTAQLDKALKMAANLHKNQCRKDEAGTPYIIHPMGVMSILSNYTNKEDVLIAGLLHDVLEDVKLPLKEKQELIVDNFGKNVLEIIEGVTEDVDPMNEGKQKYSWIERKQRYLDKVQKSSDDVLMVCAADKIHNLLSLICDYENEGEEHWAKFKVAPEGRLWLFEEVYKIVSERLQNPIVNELYLYLSKARTISQKIIKNKSNLA